MRLDLKKDIEDEKRKAVKRVIELANSAHDEIEYQTSYSALLCFDGSSSSALKLHSDILKIRQEAINKIKSAKNGAEIKTVVDSLAFV